MTDKHISKILEEKLIELSYKHDNEITLAIDDIVKLFTTEKFDVELLDTNSYCKCCGSCITT